MNIINKCLRTAAAVEVVLSISYQREQDLAREENAILFGILIVLVLIENHLHAQTRFLQKS